MRIASAMTVQTFLRGFFVALLWCAAASATPALAEEAPLKFGIMPFNSTLALIKTHQPLTAYLEKRLGRRVTVYTSADYFTFVNQLLDGQFDIAIAGPHFGSMAAERGAKVLFRYRAELQPVVVVRADSGIRTLDDLHGTRIGLSSRLSISSIGGVKWLQDHGFQIERDYRLFEHATHGAAIAGVAVGDLDAALTTHTPLKQIPEDIQAKVAVLPLDIRVPHLMTLADARLSVAEVARIRAALRDFQATPEGRAFFSETGYLGYAEVTPADLKALQPFVELTLRMMRLDR